MTESERRGVIEQHLKEHLLGPGYAKELIACSPDCSDEILDLDPTNLYVTGIVGPHLSSNTELEEEDSDTETDATVIDPEDPELDPEDAEEDDSENAKDFGDSVIDRNDRFELADHIGLITCVEPDVARIDVCVKYAKYKKVPINQRSGVKVKMGHQYHQLDSLLNIYDEDDSFRFVVDGMAPDGPLSTYVGRDDNSQTIWFTGAVSINTKLSQQASNTISNQYRKTNNIFKTLFSPFFKRESHEENVVVNVSNCGENTVSENTDIRILSKVYLSGGKKYVKVLVANKIVADGVRRSRCEKCLFQTEIKVTPQNASLISYTDPVSIQEDREGEILNFTYRNVKNYGKGIACAVEWNEQGDWIQTSYLPEIDVKKYSNELDQSYCDNTGVNQNEIKDACRLLTLSHWTNLNDNDYCQLLDSFVDGYAIWCNRQITDANNLGQQNLTNDIINKQQELLERLRCNVNYLRGNPEALDCFKMANTAMLIQMTIARDEHFKKNRIQVNEPPTIINTLSWFRNDPLRCTYRPFQLAFLLMNVKSTFDINDRYHKDVVDMIWFPTGGGKTEAYLALTAMTIIARRRSTADNSVGGVSVIMRYTLRLLASQQFERASYLICALESMRIQRGNPFGLGEIPITIGLWIGNSGRAQLGRTGKWGRFDNEIQGLNGARANERLNRNNPYPVTYCPWCGQRLVTATGYGYNGGLTRRDLQCLNADCKFNNNNLPIYFVDDDVRRVKPTLLFATVDKFALLHNTARDLFPDTFRSPDLIIQDELHLISGPMGSLVGLFESIVEKVCTRNGRTPKIIASTATTRNTDALIKSLYNRKAKVFPAPGITYNDNFFSHTENESQRRHMGVCPQGFMSPVVSEIHIIAQIVLGRISLFKEYLKRSNVDLNDLAAVSNLLKNPDDKLINDLDIFWPLVLYYNSLKDLGRTYSRVAAEIRENVRAQLRYLLLPDSLDFIIEGMAMRTKEFTSREDSSRIKDLLTSAETAIGLSVDQNGKLRVAGGTAMDIILATNMISVGIDINRWNLMMMSGQPRSVSEYIQSSSRVARRYKGLVVNLYSRMRNREFSMFENYTSFHESYYKYVEPLSATPITLETLNHQLFKNVVLCYRELFNNNAQQGIQELTDYITDRFNLCDYLSDYAYNIISSYWTQNNLEPLATSLRDIDEDDYFSINEIDYRR